MNDNKEFISGTLSTIILALLKENGRMDGNEICQKARQLTKDEILIDRGCNLSCLTLTGEKGTDI